MVFQFFGLRGQPDIIQNVNFIAATFIYFSNGLGWAAYILLLFAFDISMVGYTVNPRVGALMYNAVTGPTSLAVLYVWLDRACGYGLKLPSGFRHTHLGEIGKR